MGTAGVTNDLAGLFSGTDNYGEQITNADAKLRSEEAE